MEHGVTKCIQLKGGSTSARLTGTQADAHRRGAVYMCVCLYVQVCTSECIRRVCIELSMGRVQNALFCTLYKFILCKIIVIEQNIRNPAQKTTKQTPEDSSTGPGRLGAAV